MNDQIDANIKILEQAPKDKGPGSSVIGTVFITQFPIRKGRVVPDNINIISFVGDYRPAGHPRVIGETLKTPGYSVIGGSFEKYLFVGTETIILPDYKYITPGNRDPGAVRITRIITESLKAPVGTIICAPFVKYFPIPEGMVRPG